MKNQPSLSASYLQILNEVYDNPSNSNIVELLNKNGINKQKLNNLIINDAWSDSDMKYIIKFLKISSSNLKF